EIKRLVMESYEKAKRLLLEHFDILTSMANTLLEKEVLEGHEIDVIVNDGLAKKGGSVKTNKTENVAA
ncbi:MAG TPA: cell division protein FtsH, partial [Nitrospinae bacterium]|nr:cell division protein FtsH [Nitrospinota bacterium]